MAYLFVLLHMLELLKTQMLTGRILMPKMLFRPSTQRNTILIVKLVSRFGSDCYCSSNALDVINN